MKSGRNDPCPCGSGKKYKKCCSDKLEAGAAFPPPRPPAHFAAPEVPAAQGTPGHREIGALVSLFNQQRYMEAEHLARSVTDNFPRYGFGWKVLGAAANQLGRSADALASLQKAAALLPDDEEVHYNLGSTLHNLGRLDEAAASYRRTLAIRPNYVEAHNNLGNTLKDMGQLDEAAASYRRALQIRPGYAEAHCNLGNTLSELGQPIDAEASLRLALQIRPDFVEALNSLALLLNAQGDPATALNVVYHSLQYRETPEARNIFVACAKHLHFTQDDSGVRAAMVRALTEPWGRPSELAQAGFGLVRLNPDIGECVARAANAWPQRLAAQELFGPSPLPNPLPMPSPQSSPASGRGGERKEQSSIPAGEGANESLRGPYVDGLAALANDALLIALLDAMPVCDIETERFLTLARHALLEASMAGDETGAALSFCSVLARQCFINEYVFSFTDGEIGKAGELRDSLAAALQAGAQIPPLWLAAVAAYFPLGSLPLAGRLLEKQWPEEVAAILKQQVQEPAEERELRAAIPRLTAIEDEVSLLVQNQYEENLYPRWIRPDPVVKAKDISAYLSQKFPLASFKRPGKSDSIDVLVAGCGTGQHSIATVQRIEGAQVLAIDLSLSSLAYAKRKTQELGLTSVEYAQADLLRLGSLGRSFDVIESVGVLHHLADPYAGWQALLSLLRPGGFMELGLYSATARRNITGIWDFIAERGYGSSPEEIRRFRQDLIDAGNHAEFGAALNSADFFSTSTCRDLLFHVHEHGMTLAGIEEFLRKNKLTFLGFEIGAEVLHAYRQRVPEDRAATDLAQWQVFENENPDTFGSMYHFWVQKNE
ncbi:tetratricopeptide repeat protein [Candidatus Ferrigenium straubiae]|uniref:tetratricopeptide repeat protein n=1 Tax=Candidatus Ferrigenium straubiae TaxID=2919506 RepID=UPI003F4AB838